MYEPFQLLTGSAVSSHAPASWYFNRLEVKNPVTITGIHIPISINASVPGATSAASTGTARFTYSKGITIFRRIGYADANSTNFTTVTTGSFGLTAGLSYSSTSQSFVYSWVTDTTGGTSSYNTTSSNGNWSSFITGIKAMVIPLNTSLSVGEYFVAHNHSSTTGTTQSNLTLLSISNLHIAPQSNSMGAFGSSGGIASRHVAGVGFGVASAVTTNNTMAISVVSSSVQNIFYLRFEGA
jgi:hypothetical protein